MRARQLGATIITAAVLGTGGAAATAQAAPPDGAGPWADSVVSFTQAKRKDGADISPTRSDPVAALGAAEATDMDGTFVSLGFGGSITLGFENDICNVNGADLDLGIVEATHEPYPAERVDVFVSTDGVGYRTIASNVEKDAQVALPADIRAARFVRLTDVSDPAMFPRANAEGYDVDGVRALADPADCAPPPPPVYRGKLFGAGTARNSAGKLSVHGIKLYCDAADGKSQFAAAAPGKVFVMTAVTGGTCSDDPLIDPGSPMASFDTHKGSGTGLYNGKSGATIEWSATDAGEPGRHDRISYTIRDKNNVIVLRVDDRLTCGGNHEALDF